MSLVQRLNEPVELMIDSLILKMGLSFNIHLYFGAKDLSHCRGKLRVGLCLHYHFNVGPYSHGCFRIRYRRDKALLARDPGTQAAMIRDRLNAVART